jgi:hypothetical protein
MNYTPLYLTEISEIYTRKKALAYVHSVINCFRGNFLGIRLQIPRPRSQTYMYVIAQLCYAICCIGPLLQIYSSEILSPL